MFGMSRKPPPTPAPTPAKKAKAEADALVAVTVMLMPDQRDMLELLGGDAWLREQIEHAKLPSA